MSYTPKILAFAGSARKDSFNKKAVAIAAQGARDAGAEVTLIDLADYPMPIYDGDLESSEGLPENALKLKQLFWDHDGLLISSPEYNGSISPLLKNTIDWVSRGASSDEKPLSCYVGKTCVLLATSPGALGGLRGLAQVRTLLSGIQVVVLPQQRAISGAGTAFGNDGNLVDEAQQTAVMNLGKTLADYLTKFHG